MHIGAGFSGCDGHSADKTEILPFYLKKMMTDVWTLQEQTQKIVQAVCRLLASIILLVVSYRM